MLHRFALRDLLRRRSGSVSLTFALSILPIMLLAGIALDYSAVLQKKMLLQSALDSALLAGSSVGLKALNTGSSQTAAIAAAQAAAAGYFRATAGTTGTLTTTYSLSGLALSGTGSVAVSAPLVFGKVFGVNSISMSVKAQTSGTVQPFENVYLLVDISASMLLPSTTAGINQMISGKGCALACHDQTNGTDSYAYAVNQGIQLRYQVVNQGIQNLINFLNSSSIYQNKVKVGVWSLDNTLTQVSGLTSNFPSVLTNLPAPAVAYTNASAATTFNDLIGSFVSAVGSAGDGSSTGSPKKLVIIASDGVNDPTRDWTWNTPLRDQVKVFDTGFCNTLQQAGVTVAIINTPYYPMTWDWGYNATLGQPGTLGGATRVDDIPIALRACAGGNFVLASDVSTIQASFTTLFQQASRNFLSR